MGKSVSQPPAPDPAVVAKEQAKASMVNSTGPYGSVTYKEDPTAPAGFAQTTQLTPQQQAILSASQSTELGAVNIAHDQLGRVSGALAAPLDTNGLPALAGGINTYGTNRQYSYDSPNLKLSMPNTSPVQLNVDLQHGFDPGQQVQGHVGPQDLAGAARQAQDASYAQATARLDPRFTQDENAMRTRLANQGLSENSDAYRTAEQNFTQGKNDAYQNAQNQAVLQGNAAQDQLFGESLQQGQFANSAAGQQYAQNQGLAQFGNNAELQGGQFYNAAADQQFQKQLARFGAENGAAATQAGLNEQKAAFNNTAVADQRNSQIQQAQLQNTARNQGLQERAYVQNQPINQLTGLLGLGQVQMPTGIQYQTPDVTGAYALQSQVQQANANRQAQASGGLMGGLFSLGSSAILASDRRLKTHIRRVGTRPDGLGVYLYRYRGEPEEHFGVMAQEVKRKRPDAVLRRPDGYLGVNYMTLEAA